MKQQIKKISKIPNWHHHASWNLMLGAPAIISTLRTICTILGHFRAI